MATQLRVSDELMEEAEKHVKVSYRSIPKQIEFWAKIGQEVESYMTPADLAALVSGEVEVQLIRKKSEPVDMDSIFSGIENERKSGTLSRRVIKDPVWFEESMEHPGYLIRVDAATGNRQVGIFEAGAFRAKAPTKQMGKVKRSK